MKDFLSVFGCLSGRKYSAVSTRAENVNSDHVEPSSSGRRPTRSSSVVVNRFFTEAALLDKQKRSRCAVFLMLAGVIGIAAGCFIVFAKPYDVLFRWKVTFSDGGETFLLWQKPPVELLLKVYLFNVTNKEEFLRGEKLRVEEVGPYVYREHMEHSNVSFLENGTLVSVPKHPLVWAQEYTNRSEDDVLILPNIALLSIANVMKDASYFSRMGLNFLIRRTHSEALVEMTAKEFMFGYKSTLTTLGHNVLPSWIFFDKIGLIDRMYDFTGDFSTIFTGETDVRKSGLFDTYRGSKHLSHWYKGKECENVSLVHGTSDASKFPSFIEPNDTLVMYRRSLCRTMPMERTGETVFGGLQAYTYTWKEGILDNGARNPENKCFCRGDNCLPEGLLDVADCYYGFPIAISYPHFYKVDPSVLEHVDGSHPEKEKHASYFIIQRETGLTLSLAVRMQINMAFGDISTISGVERFKNMILPMIWTEISMEELPQDLQNRFYLYLNTVPVLLRVLTYVLFICGPIMLIGSIARVFWKTWEKRKEEAQEANIKNCRKYWNCVQADRQSTIKAKEMDVFFTSLLVLPPEHAEYDRLVKTKAPTQENMV